MSNLFDDAKKNSSSNAKAAKEEKLRVTIKDEEFFEKVERLERIQESIKKEKNIADILSEEIKRIALKQWAKLYKEIDKNPGTLIIESRRENDIAQMMLVPTDRYLIIDEKRAHQLTEEYGDDAIEENISFTFDNAMVDKYGELLSKFIEECDEIEKEDKARIIRPTTTISVKKGTLEKMKDMAEENDKNILEVVNDFKPVIAVKGVEIIRA